MENNTEKKSKLFFDRIFLSLLPLLLLAWAVYALFVYFSVYRASFIIDSFLPDEILRTTIYGSTKEGDGSTVPDTISANFTLIDSSGSEIASIERSWNGAYLSVEFVRLQLNNKVFIFPANIYGKQNITQYLNKADGHISLEKYYDEGRKCLFLGSGYTKQQKKALFLLSRYANNRLFVFRFGSVKSYFVDLSECEPKAFYSIGLENAGKLSVVRL